MKKAKILSLLLAITTVFAMIPALLVPATAVEVQTQTDIPDNENSVTIDNKTFVVIRTVEELNAALAADTAHTNNYILDADLDYTGKTFNTITIATGIFDGNGHKMYGYNLEDTGTFATVDENSNATIRNLTIGTDAAKIVVTDTRTKFPEVANTVTVGSGAVFGSALGNNVIENVTVYAEITSLVHAGGFVGQFSHQLTIRNSTFYGSVSQTSSSVKGYFGGFVGIASQSFEKLELDGCVNYGTVTAADSSNVGGFVGYTRNRGTSHNKDTLTLTNCINHGAITGKNTGGMIGQYQDATNAVSATMTGCLNAGEITASTGAGGLVGHCYARKSFTISNCANIGVIHGTEDKNAGGWIASIDDGGSKSLSFNNCASFGEVENVLLGNLYNYGTNKIPPEISITDSYQKGQTTGITDADNARADSTEITTYETNADCLTWLRNNFSDYLFAEENGAIKITNTPAEAKFLQYKKGANGLDIRLLGVFNGAETKLNDYANVGFELTFKTGKGETAETVQAATPYMTTTVYTSINANTDLGLTTYQATDLGASYLYAINLTNIPTSGIYTIEIRAFATGTEANAQPVYDNMVTLTIVEGQIQ